MSFSFIKLYLFISECFLPSFLSGVDFFFNLDLYLLLSLLYGTQVYSFAAIPAICRLCSIFEVCLIFYLFVLDFYLFCFTLFTLFFVFTLFCSFVIFFPVFSYLYYLKLLYAFFVVKNLIWLTILLHDHVFL